MIAHSILVLIFSLEYLFAIWIPDLTFTPNLDQFKLYKSKHLESILSSPINKKVLIDFQWQSVASISLFYNKTSYIIYGGSQKTYMGSNSAFPKSISAIVICQLTFVNESSILNSECSKVDTKDRNEYLGVSIETISMSDKEVVIVFCDPLWHANNQSVTIPSGKCYLSLVSEGKFVKNDSIDLCRFGHRAEYCLGGFSIDLIRNGNELSKLQMVVGLPFLSQYGSVQIFEDLFGAQLLNDPKLGRGRYFNFGYAVSSISTSLTYVSSPASDQSGSYVISLIKDVILKSPGNFTFGSFGMSLKTLNIKGGKNHAVVIGAPFHPLKSVQNVGKVYVYCATDNGNNVWLVSEIHGKQSDEFFGYALANIGDINGDGNEDLAISSPFLRNDDGRGFVSIYTVNSNCEVSANAQQILRNPESQKIGIYGLSIAGKSDLDFNGWPDIVVLDSHSNSVRIFASRTHLKVKCTPILPTENNLWIRYEKIMMGIRLTFGDVDPDFLKHFNLIPQIDLNWNTTEKRFQLLSDTLTYSLANQFVLVTFGMRALMPIKDMDLTVPIIFATRLVEDCSAKDCEDTKLPFINWDYCRVIIPARKYDCNILPICNADLFIELSDQNGSEVIYGHDKSFSRTLILKIFNLGPTVGKDINFRVSTNQNLRIHKIKSVNKTPLRERINQNQTEAICYFLEVDIDIKSEAIVVTIDLFFADFHSAEKMNYADNFVVVNIFSEIKDSNHSNNRARIDYTFLYLPNITFAGSPIKDTIVDPRNGSIRIPRGKRLALEKLGPMLTHQYIAENSGDAFVTDLTVKVNIPMKTKNGHRILYFFDMIRTINGTNSYWMSILPQIHVGSKSYPCTIPAEYINPDNIIGFESSDLRLQKIDIREVSDRRHKMKRRSVVWPVHSPASLTDDKTTTSQGNRLRIPIEIIHCDRKSVNLKAVVCAEMTCKVPVLPPHNQASLQINAWLWAHTFYKKQIPDIIIYTTIRAEFPVIPTGVRLQRDQLKSFSQSQHFIFQNFKSKITHFKPLWPIVLGIVVGILILAILIVAMYKCGFFQRDRAKERRRAERQKRSKGYPIIVHPGEMRSTSSECSETQMESHSTLIK